MDSINYLAITMGLMSSFHCVGMCGPIVLALPVGNGTKSQQIVRISIYNTGRIITYSILGLVLGTVGSTLAWVGYLRYLSIFAGVLMIAYVLWPNRANRFLHVPGFWSQAVQHLKKNMGQMLKSRTLFSSMVLGMLNGLLPCGLVYLALISSVAAGNMVQSATYMLFFGLGTLPAMMSVGFFKEWFTPFIRTRIRQLTPFILGLAGIWLVARGVMIQFPIHHGQEIPVCHGN